MTTLLALTACVTGGAAAAVLAAGYLLTGSGAAVAVGLGVAAACGAGMAALALLLQKKLTAFTGALCADIDRAVDGGEPPREGLEAETQLSRVRHRLARLCGVLRHQRASVAAERAALQSLVSDISHQTRAPVTNLSLLLETLADEGLPAGERRAFLDAARGEADKLDFLIRALVKTSRLESGAIRPLKAPARLYDTLAAAVQEVYPALRDKGMELEVDCPEDLILPHDARWTGEALFNLLDNAVKYTPPGGRIRVAVDRWEAHTKIDVIDDGRGIPEAHQAAVFRRFYREDAVHGAPGVGIGLYLAREIVTLQGGYILLRSQAGAGSTFSVFLPNG